MKNFKNVLIAVFVLIFGFGITGIAMAAPTTVDLGTAGNFAILAGTAITDVPSSVITGNVGLSPAAGSLYSGLTQAEVTGTIYSTNGAGPAGYVENAALLTTAKNDLTAAFTDAQGRVVDSTIATELGGQTLTAGVYDSENTRFQITSGAGPLVLDGQGDSSSVFIFKMGFDGTGLTVGSHSMVSLINDASACNVFWEVNTATINTSATFKGNILALNAITVAGGVGTGSNIEGRLLARNANVTLDHTTVTAGSCGAATVTPTPTPATSGTATAATATASSTATSSSLPATGADSGGTGSSLIWLLALVAVVPIIRLFQLALKRSSKE